MFNSAKLATTRALNRNSRERREILKAGDESKLSPFTHAADFAVASVHSKPEMRGLALNNQNH